ncbi:peptidyl-prolyl cis-trans isomerase D-like isoform X2 [Lycorma delicatula]
MIQGGDVTHFDGSGGESIYGSTFEDENFLINHNLGGEISMVNAGRPNSNNSQFFITTVPCPHLNGQNVVFGRVKKGLGAVKMISEVATNNERPISECRIVDCGQFKPGQDWGIAECDGTEDEYPPFPEDWKNNPSDVELERLHSVAMVIKKSGNFYFDMGNYVDANRKYKKALRYIDWYMMHLKKKSMNSKILTDIKILCKLNSAAALLKKKEYYEVRKLCSEVLRVDKNNAKALFRRGQANFGLNDNELALKDLERAHAIDPIDKKITDAINAVKKNIKIYLNKEKESCRMMFKDI